MFIISLPLGSRDGESHMNIEVTATAIVARFLDLVPDLVPSQHRLSKTTQSVQRAYGLHGKEQEQTDH